MYEKPSYTGIKLEKNALPGYSLSVPTTYRRAILDTLVDLFGWGNVVQKLNVLYVFNKNKKPDNAAKFRKDMYYVQKTHSPTGQTSEKAFKLNSKRKSTNYTPQPPASSDSSDCEYDSDSDCENDTRYTPKTKAKSVKQKSKKTKSKRKSAKKVKKTKSKRKSAKKVKKTKSKRKSAKKVKKSKKSKSRK